MIDRRFNRAMPRIWFGGDREPQCLVPVLRIGVDFYTGLHLDEDSQPVWNEGREATIRFDPERVHFWRLIVRYFVPHLPVQWLEVEYFDLEPENKKLVQPEILPEILWAAAIAIVGGVLSLYVENYKLFTRFVQMIGATKVYGDEGVWDFVFNSRSRAVDFVHLRDFEQRVTYAGFVETFSESGQLREIILSEVAVYDFEGTEMYRVPRLYLARGREDLHIEFPVSS
jgi:hypothetical protein